MKIVVLTITCNRLDLTKRYLSELKRFAGMKFSHVIVDNGSDDGTVEYLTKLGYEIISLRENIGIHDAMLVGIDYVIKKYNPDVIVKFDNDCKILSENILLRIANFYNAGCKSRILAPLDIRILPQQQPRVFKEVTERNERLRYSEHVGGIFLWMPREAAKLLLTNKLERNGDLFRGRFWISKGYDMIYMLDIQVDHEGIGNQTSNYTL